jgi:hypothetical protein
MFHFSLLAFPDRSTPLDSSPAFLLPGDSVRLLANQKMVSPPALNDIPEQDRFLL